MQLTKSTMILLWTFVCIFCTSFSVTLLPHKNEFSIAKLQCVTSLLQKISTTNKVLLTNVEEEGFSKGVALLQISSSGQSRSFLTIPEPSLYILDLRLVSLRKIINRLKSMLIFNPKALFYLIIPEFRDIHISNLMRNRILKAVIATMEGYTYSFLYPQLELLKNISQCGTIELETKSLPLKYLRDFKLNAVLRISFPHVTGNGTGFEESMIKYIQTWLKINVSFSYRQMGVMLLLFILYFVPVLTFSQSRSLTRNPKLHLRKT